MESKSTIANALAMPNLGQQLEVTKKSLEEIQVRVKDLKEWHKKIASTKGMDAKDRESCLKLYADLEDRLKDPESALRQAYSDAKNGLEVQASISAPELCEKLRKARENAEGSCLEVDDRLSKSADIVFAMDLTGSIQDSQTVIIGIIDEFLAQVQKKCPVADVRVGFVGYYDLPLRANSPGLYEEWLPETKRAKVMPFIRSTTEIKDLLKAVEPGYGWDTPEDVNLGLRMAVRSMAWVGRNRCIIHIGDGPAHGEKYNRERDNYPTGIPGDVDFQEIFDDMVENAIHYVFVKLNNLTKLMLEEFKEHHEAAKVKCQKSPSMFLVVDDLKMAISKIMSVLFHSIRKTVSKRKSNQDNDQAFKEELDRSAKKFLLQEEEAEDKPTFIIDQELVPEKYWPTEKRTLSYLNPIELDVMQVLNPSSELSFKKTDKIIKIAPHPFGECAGGYVWRARDDLFDHGLVLKMFIGSNGKQQAHLEIRKRLLAQRTAYEYNRRVKKPEWRLYFSDSCLVTYQTLPCVVLSQLDNFEKQTNNYTEVNPSARVHCAFQHFSYCYTGGKLMINDLQGDNRLLTDPAIATADGIFLPLNDTTDMRYEGIIGFFTSHKCNEICEHLGITEDRAASPTNADLMNDCPPAMTLKDEVYQKCLTMLCKRNALPGQEFCQKCTSLSMSPTKSAKLST